MDDTELTETNVLGGPLLACSYAPLTGYYRDGCCATHGEQGVAHLVCVKVTAEFLAFSRKRGNVLRFVEALDADMAPRVVLAATNAEVLKYVALDDLKRCSIDAQ